MTVQIIFFAIFFGAWVIGLVSARAMANADPAKDFWKVLLFGGWMAGRLGRVPTWVVLLAWIALCVTGISLAVDPG